MLPVPAKSSENSSNLVAHFRVYRASLDRALIIRYPSPVSAKAWAQLHSRGEAKRGDCLLPTVRHLANDHSPRRLPTLTIWSEPSNAPSAKFVYWGRPEVSSGVKATRLTQLRHWPHPPAALLMPVRCRSRSLASAAGAACLSSWASASAARSHADSPSVRSVWYRVIMRLCCRRVVGVLMANPSWFQETPWNHRGRR